MKKFRIFAALATLGIILSGCSSAPSAVEKLSIEEFAVKTQETGVVVLDVRTPMEFAEGHLEKAVNVDFQSGSFEVEVSKLDRDVTYAVYCRSGNRSGQAVKQMADLGFKSLYDMDGGVIEWTAAGKPIFTN